MNGITQPSMNRESLEQELMEIYRTKTAVEAIRLFEVAIMALPTYTLAAIVSVESELPRPRSVYERSAVCAYDGTFKTFADGRCSACGRDRLKAVIDARNWRSEQGIKEDENLAIRLERGREQG